MIDNINEANFDLASTLQPSLFSVLFGLIKFSVTFRSKMSITREAWGSLPCLVASASLR